MNNIDTDMTAAYLKAVQDTCEKAAQRIRELETELDITRKQNIALSAAANASPWQPRDTTPPDGTRCIIRTKDGATFMFEPIGKKWPQWVDKWMYIPT